MGWKCFYVAGNQFDVVKVDGNKIKATCFKILQWNLLEYLGTSNIPQAVENIRLDISLLHLNIF